MKLSIITICFNSENVIRRTIDSVLNQDYFGDVEYLIIDGASTDKTIEIVESYRDAFDVKGYKYVVISEPDNGIYDAMNKGIKHSAGDIIGIINSGDWYENNALSTVVSTYESIPFDYLYADINLIKPNGRVIIKHSKNDKLVSSRHWNHPTSFVTKSTYKELGTFRCEGIHDDFDFFLRVKKAQKNIVIQNIVLADFVTGGASNKKSVKDSIKRVKDRYKCYRNNGYSCLYIVECLAIEIAKWIIS